MDNKLFNDNDLADLFAELNDTEDEVPEEVDEEMEASQRRYMEIIKKHKSEN